MFTIVVGYCLARHLECIIDYIMFLFCGVWDQFRFSGVHCYGGSYAGGWVWILYRLHVFVGGTLGIGLSYFEEFFYYVLRNNAYILCCFIVFIFNSILSFA